MATAQTIINRTLRLIGAIGSGDSPTADETADCLVALNDMLDSWRNERLMVYAMTEVTHTLTVSDASYSIGSGGDIDTTRPVKIEDAYMRENNIDYPIKIVDEKEWNRISDKTITGNIIEKLYYNPGMSTGTIKIFPVPTIANVIYLTLWTPLTAFAAASDTVTLPPGWARAMSFNLAPEIAPEFGRSVSAEVADIARKSLAVLKRVNSPKMLASSDLAAMFSSSRPDIENDE